MDYLLVCVDSDDKSDIILIYIPLSAMCLSFPMAEFKIFCQCVVCFSNLIIIGYSVVFFVFVPLGVYWIPWICGFVIVSNVERILSHFFKQSFCSYPNPTPGRQLRVGQTALIVKGALFIHSM